ncbi:AAA family ATPase [Amycolatopsis sp. H6(2020)]|nr:AAA family ATPase [Amycolatopsis sp. H6(2020)]
MTPRRHHDEPVGLRLVNREGERSELAELLTAVHSGESRVLVVRGDAGVGKTALMDYALGSVASARTLRARGVESEMELAYAALHQLCAPLLDALPELPEPQRGALRTIFGQHSGPPPERFMVGLSVLSLVSHAARTKPLLCLVEDAQWLDQSSAQVLGFVARRLQAESILMAFSSREPVPELAGLPELVVEGLADTDARTLLAIVTRTPVDPRILDRVLAEAQGNPLALLELPRGLSATEVAGGFGLLGSETVPERVEQTFRDRIAQLSDETRCLLLVAAAEPVGDPVLTWRAIERLGVTDRAAAIEGTEGLLKVDERVTFRHPLVRSAAYGVASLDERQGAHRALAAVTDADLDPDRRAWHLAAAATRPDETVAAELERAAERARSTGGVAATAAFLQRAAILTEDPSLRADRALAAVGASFQAGDLDAARRFLGLAERGELNAFQTAQALLLRGQTAFAIGMGPGGEAAPMLIEAARRLQPFGIEMARETLVEAWGAAMFAGQPEHIVSVCRAARELPAPDDPRPLDLLLEGYALLTTEGRDAATPVLRRAAEAVSHLPESDVLRWGWIAGGAASAVWDNDLMDATYNRQLRIAREAGALSQLPFHLASLTHVAIGRGELEAATALIGETDAAAQAVGSPLGRYAHVWLEGLRGREVEATALAASTIEWARATGQQFGVTAAQWGLALLYNGLAKYDAAVAAAREATSSNYEPWMTAFALPELIESACRCGQSALAEEALDRLVQSTTPSGTDWALGIEARSRALLSAGDEAEVLYRDAIERLGRTKMAPELARAHLLYGEWLRREGRRSDAKVHLRGAHESLAAIGMEAFAERARRELLATGERARRRSVETRIELTAQELQIASLARDGLSNQEIGDRLFLSSRTVEWHLSKIFPKLGISSRRALRSVLPGGDELIST